MKEKVEDLDDFDDFELTGKEEVKQPSLPTQVNAAIYGPETSWDINSGMNSSRLHKLYSLLFDKESTFSLDGDVSVSGISPLDNTYCLAAKNNDQQIFLFKPAGYTAYYNTDSKTDPGWLGESFQKSLDDITAFCATATKPATFVVPCMEMPTNMGKGVQHQILLTLSYDPLSKQLTPTVYDSIGRDTYAESFSSYFKSKSRTTCDEIVGQSLQQAVKKTASRVTLNELNRIAYNHQNRLTEGNCGSYSFRTIKEVISSVAQGTPVKIPGSGYITSDSYLTGPHVQQIEQCIKYRNLNSAEIDRSMNEGIPVPGKLAEFISALEHYSVTRGKQPEKSMLNFVGFSKADKLEAVALLTGILKDIQEGKEISEPRYYKFKEQIPCLMDSSLGNLVQFHLKSLEAESLDLLVSPSVNIEFDMLGDDLFDVPDITGKALASDKQVPLDKDGIERQKKIKEGLSELQENTDFTEHVVISTKV